MAFECELMDDPVVAADGHTYNRKEMETWLEQHNTSPLTHETLEHKMLIPNLAMRRQINAWREEHGHPALVFGQSVKAKAQGGAPRAPPIVKPAAVCSFSKKPLQAVCVTCRKSICSNCAIYSQRCKLHITRPLDAIVSGIRDSHAAWVHALEGRPLQLQAEYDRIDAAGNAAFQAIRAEIAELKQKLQRACVGDMEGVIREQAQLLADVELSAASPDAAVSDSEPSRCLLAAATRAPRLPRVRGGWFQAAAAEAVSVRRLGFIVGGGGVGGVSAAGAGFLRAFGPVLQTSAAPAVHAEQPAIFDMGFDRNLVESALQQFGGNTDQALEALLSGLISSPAQPAHEQQNPKQQRRQQQRLVQHQQRQQHQFLQQQQQQQQQDDWGEVAMHQQQRQVQQQQQQQQQQQVDWGNPFVAMHPQRQMQQLLQRQPFEQRMQQPSCCVFDDEGNLVVSDYGNHRILVLRFSDGMLLRTIGSQGSGNSQFQSPLGIAFDGAGHILVAEEGGQRVQMLRYSDGEHIRTIGASRGRGGDSQFNCVSSIACDGSGNLAVFDHGNARVQVFRLSDGALVRTISNDQFNGSRGFLAFDADSNLVVGSNDSQIIQVLSFSDGRCIRTISIAARAINSSQAGIPQQHVRPQRLMPCMRPMLSNTHSAGSCSGIAFDGAGHILVADQAGHCVRVLRYADGAHVRTIGSCGQGEGQLYSPVGVAVDADGLVAVCDCQNNRVQVFE